MEFKTLGFSHAQILGNTTDLHIHGNGDHTHMTNLSPSRVSHYPDPH